MKDVTIVVGTVGQSIMRSEDDGKTWARIGPRHGFAYEASVRCIAMHPRQPNILFAGTEKGLYRSDDAGANWQIVDSALNSYYLWAPDIDPFNAEIMVTGSGTPTTPAPQSHPRPLSLWLTVKSMRARITARPGKRSACRQTFRGNIREKKLTCAVSPCILLMRRVSCWGLVTLRRDQRVPLRDPTT